MTRPSPSLFNTVLTVVLFVFVMALGLVAVGGAFGAGVGTVELSIWFVVVLAGCVLIVTRHRRARAAAVGA
jgi:hypothetical protein